MKLWLLGAGVFIFIENIFLNIGYSLSIRIKDIDFLISIPYQISKNVILIDISEKIDKKRLDAIEKIAEIAGSLSNILNFCSSCDYLYVVDE